MGKKKPKQPAAAQNDDDALLEEAIKAAAAARIEEAAAAAQTGCSTAAQLKMPLRSLKERDGRDGSLTEANGRLFYNLLSCLSELALPRLNSARAQLGKPPLTWNVVDQQANDLFTRGQLQEYVLGHVDELTTAVASGQHDRAFSRILGHRNLPRAKAALRGWSLHVDDDFFITGLVDDGAVFVQCVGDHAEHVYVVKALATPFHDMLSRNVEELGDLVPIRTVLLQHGDCITYFSTMLPASFVDGRVRRSDGSGHDKSQKTIDALTARAKRAYARAVETGQVHRQLCAQLVRRVPLSAATSELFNNYDTPYGGQKVGEGDSAVWLPSCPSAATELTVGAFMWLPYSEWADPRREAAMDRVIQGEYVAEGVKRQLAWQIFLKDEERCLLCGKTPFATCCKDAHIARGKSADAASARYYLYDPFDEATADRIYPHAVAASTDGRPFNAAQHLLASPMEVQEIELQVPRHLVELVQDRMNDSPLFLTTMPSAKWDYLGFFPTQFAQAGLLTFGDITIDASGTFKAGAMTARRATALIDALRHLTCDMEVRAPKLTVTPEKHATGLVDLEALESNVSRLSAGLDEDATTTVRKGQFRSYKRCTYCDVVAEPGSKIEMKSCPCNDVLYCSVACQRGHWPTHKKGCTARREKKGKASVAEVD